MVNTEQTNGSEIELALKAFLVCWWHSQVNTMYLSMKSFKKNVREVWQGLGSVSIYPVYIYYCVWIA